eukprot:PhM_4_TR14349/c0_g1_i1/m.38013
MFRRSFTSRCLVNRAPRSSFKYEGSVNNSDVGARNESAYIPYEAFEPSDLAMKYAMPSLNNILTSMFIEIATGAVFMVSTSIVLWDQWVQRKYDVVRLPAPMKQME